MFMKYTLLFLFTLAISNPLWAQNDPAYTVEAYFTDTEIRAANEEFRSFLDEASAQFFESNRALWAQFAAGEITETDLRGQHGALSAAHLLKLKSKNEEIENKLFSGAYQKLLFADQNQEDNGIEEFEDDDFDLGDMDFSSFGPKARRGKGNFMLALGWHTLLNQSAVSSASYPDVNFWRSGMIELGFQYQYRLSKNNAKSPWHWNSSLSYLSQSVRWKENRYLLETGSPTFWPVSGNIRRNNFETGYIVLTTGLAYKSHKKRGLRAELAAFGGVSVDRQSYIRFRNTDRRGSTTSIITGDYGVNTFAYGMTASIGIKNIALYSRYDFSSLFRDNSQFNLHPFSIGVRFF
jgi:hypothetical protein